MSAFRISNFLATPAPSRLLIVGDLLAFLTFVILGRIVHADSGPADWLLNAPRIAAPFLLGWTVAATILGAYPRAAQLSSSRFLLVSLAALLAGDLIAFAVRAYVFSDPVTLPFVLTSLAFTTLLVVGWRVLYISVYAAKTQRTVKLH